jgi:phage gp29-like protein
MNEMPIARPPAGLEVATSADGRDITRPFVGPLLVPADRVLRARGAGDLLIYEQVLSDPQVKACFEQRRNAVTSCEWTVEAASDRRVDKKAADWIEQQIKRVGFDNLTDKMLYSVFYGYAVAEIIYDIQGGLLGWSAIKVRNRRRFRFKADGELRMLTVANALEGEPCPVPYFWHIATGADHDDEPYGIGLGHWCYWPTLFKRNGIAFWLTFLEKFASPTAKGTYPVNATADEKSRLLAALAAIRTDSAIAFPEGMTADLIEASRSGTADYKVLHDTMDATIAKAILGQTMTTENGSSKSQAEVHMDVRQDIVKADADLVCESLNLGPVRWLTMFNFPGAEPPRVFRTVQEPEDANTLAERDAKVIEMGYKPSLDYIRETYGDHWEEKPAEQPPAVQPGVPGAGASGTLDPALEFADAAAIATAKADAQARLDAVIEGATNASRGWRAFVAPRIQELRVLLDQSDDLVAFRDRIAELADNDPTDEFVETLARAGFGANLLGRVAK